MYRVLLVDDEILVRDAIRENIDWNKQIEKNSRSTCLKMLG